MLKFTRGISQEFNGKGRGNQFAKAKNKKVIAGQGTEP
jgi:hypothetical protein